LGLLTVVRPRAPMLAGLGETGQPAWHRISGSWALPIAAVLVLLDCLKKEAMSVFIN
jgi:hypothetical protein